MDLFLAAVGITVGILFFVAFLNKYCSWKKRRKDRAKISFKRFYDLYSKDSWPWSLYGDCVQLSSYPFEYVVEFESYLDVLRYKWFRKKAAKERIKESQEAKQIDLEKELDKMDKRYGEVKEDGKQ